MTHNEHVTPTSETLARIGDLDIEAMLGGGRCPPGLAARTTSTTEPDDRPIIRTAESV